MTTTLEDSAGNQLTTPETPKLALESKIITAEDITLDFIKKRPLSKSSLSAFNESPKHYVEYLNKKKDSSGFLLGNLIDCMVLEPEKFEERYYIYQKTDLRTKAGKAQRDKSLFEAGKRMLITDQDYRTSQFMQTSLMDHRESRQLIEARFDVQKKLKWTDPKTKLPLVGYQDFSSRPWGDKLTVDLKSSKSAAIDDFNKDIANYDYDLQNGTYRAYYKRRFEFNDFIFLVIENHAPYNVSVIFCDSKFNEVADAMFRGSIQAFAKALLPYEDKPNHFHLGYEFKLFGTKPYFSAEIPRWKKPAYLGFE